MASNGRRPIPTHPPYCLMIGQAIRSVGDPRGSTEASISRYIRANFEGLPPGHDRLLPYYLNKLVSERELMIGGNANGGRYLIAQDIVNAAGGGGGDAEGVPISCEGKGEGDDDVAMKVDQLNWDVVNIVSDEQLQLADPAKFSGKLVREMQWVDPDQDTSVAAAAVAKRRGRPPKSNSKSKAVDVFDKQLVNISGKLVEQMQMQMQLEDPADPVTLVASSGHVVEETVAGHPKKRGRPFKSKSKSKPVTGAEEASSSSVKRRGRGRPRQS